MTSLADRQLEAIAEVRELSRRLAVEVWLGGGWAADFSLGRVTRDHAEVDWFAWAGHVPAIAAALSAAGWQDGPADGAQRTLVRQGVHMSFRSMQPDPRSAAAVADARVGRIGAQHCLTMSPRGQLVSGASRVTG